MQQRRPRRRYAAGSAAPHRTGATNASTSSSLVSNAVTSRYASSPKIGHSAKRKPAARKAAARAVGRDAVGEAGPVEVDAEARGGGVRGSEPAGGIAGPGLGGVGDADARRPRGPFAFGARSNAALEVVRAQLPASPRDRDQL